MAMLAVTMAAVVTPLVLAGERGLFHMPDMSEVRLQKISRAGNEGEWPFSVASGTLACVWSGGARVVSFVEDPAGDGDNPEPQKPRHVIVTVNPFELTFFNIANRDLFLPVDTVEALIKRVAPFAALGERLCDQPQGTQIGPGEL
ncbi:hypothetical protein [Aminobacter sp. AP02]|uniref:hypothetical protein n=1 Tax=Aminobacter sp. AP02 TaxID=2135737 RepID=UPI000D6C3B32|nr:hypothetical protein [Aminobacter sp. AP02]PWK71761.1 hypothetical protein C8K44_106277 [Aminobacter sp. AP02]